MVVIVTTVIKQKCVMHLAEEDHGPSQSSQRALTVPMLAKT